MKFYRLKLCHENGESCGFQFFTSRREAEAAFREFMTPPDRGNEEWVTSRDGTEIDVIEIEPTKAGILRALKLYAEHPDNG